MNLEHKKRVFSAVVGLIGLLAIYFSLGHFGVALIVMGISTASYYEFLKFSHSAPGVSLGVALALGLGLSAWLCFDLPGSLNAIYFVTLVFLLEGFWHAHSGAPDSLRHELLLIESRLFGLLYTIAFPSFVPKVHSLPHGPLLLLFLIGVIWLGDIGAYYGGKMFGKNKLSSNISPGKTREGAMVAFLVCAAWGVGFGGSFLAHIPPWKWILIAILASGVAQVGDLLESLMKRAYAVKDSGHLIPGHGGVFDRFDSLILAAPFFYLLLRLTT